MSEIENSKDISLLREQLAKLESSDFELKTWKSFTIIILDRIFGNNSQKIKQIEKINYDYSSWSLRDTSGSSGNKESCKKLAGEILESSIMELENTIKSESVESEEDKIKSDLFLSINDIKMIFHEELKGSQIKELKLILSSDDKPVEIKSRLIGKIKEFGVNTAPQILALLLLNKDISKSL